MKNIYLECKIKNFNKFYFLLQEYEIVICVWGRIDSHGSNKTFIFPDELAANKFYNKQIIKKIKRNYFKVIRVEKSDIEIIENENGQLQVIFNNI